MKSMLHKGPPQRSTGPLHRLTSSLHPALAKSWDIRLTNMESMLHEGPSQGRPGGLQQLRQHSHALEGLHNAQAHAGHALHEAGRPDGHARASPGAPLHCCARQALPLASQLVFKFFAPAVRLCMSGIVLWQCADL